MLRARHVAVGRDSDGPGGEASVMASHAWAPSLFDTSAESSLVRSRDSALRDWFREYLSLYQVHVSAVTVIERIRGYSLLSRRAEVRRREAVEAARITYLSTLGPVLPLDGPTGVVAVGTMALFAPPPTLPRRARQMICGRHKHPPPAGFVTLSR